MFLDDPEELGLTGQRQFPDLIKEQSTSLRFFYTTDSLDISSGEGAFFIAEQYTLDQTLGNSGTVDDDKGFF